MAITKEKLPQTSVPESSTRVTNSPRPSGVAGIPMSSRPSGVAGMPTSSRPSGVASQQPTAPHGRNDFGSNEDEMGYGRIVKVIRAVSI